jgi:hypothetical protein
VGDETKQLEWQASGNGVHVFAPGSKVGRCVAIAYDPDGQDRHVAHANAELIARAVNAHDDLLEVVELARQVMNDLARENACPMALALLAGPFQSAINKARGNIKETR